MIESSNKKEGWPECFQDLGSWCPLPQDELHTPKVNLQDEFNFSNDDGYVNEWDQLSSPVDLQCDPWVNDSQLGLSSYQTGIGDLNNSVIQEGIPLGTIQKTTNILGSGGKLLTVTSDRCRSPLKSKGNVLLSQGIVKSVSEDSTLLNMAATLEHKSKDSIVIANNCYLLPVTVPEFDSAKLNSSSLSTSYLTTTTPLQLSLTQASLPPTKKVSIVKGNTLKSALTNQTNLLENLQVKEEEQGIDKCFKLPPVAIEGGNNDVEPVQAQRRLKPQLKLNIAAANNASKFTTTLSTPEVLRPLVDEDTKEFNLLQYVCNDGEYSGLIQEDEEENRPVEEQAHRDHDYTSDPYSIADVKSDLIIKCEPGSPASTSCTIKKSTNTKRGRPKRKRQRDDSSDYVVSDSDESLSEEEEDDSQQEWSPAKIKRKKRKSSTNSNNKNKLTTGGRKSISRRTSTSSNNNNININNLLDIEEPTHDKYRALRERNNEASRRSRMNRKQRDVEMLQQADELHKKNVYLKARADKMESLVKYMRAEIMKALTKPK
ncbi:hypothetical protein O3M35_000639 [Rhynocoris fuscipes]|uniref:BZIP domain-containing protein n=1 Tax=Rhynocoris fuscipes TaxID=488301 RepID=A0AAW1DNA9_9HEMI